MTADPDPHRAAACDRYVAFLRSERLKVPAYHPLATEYRRSLAILVLGGHPSFPEDPPMPTSTIDDVLADPKTFADVTDAAVGRAADSTEASCSSCRRRTRPRASP